MKIRKAVIKRRARKHIFIERELLLEILRGKAVGGGGEEG